MDKRRLMGKGLLTTAIGAGLIGICWTDLAVSRALGQPASVKQFVQIRWPTSGALALNGDFYYMFGKSSNTASNGEELGPAQIGWQLTEKDYVVVQDGLPSSGSVALVVWAVHAPGTMPIPIDQANTLQIDLVVERIRFLASQHRISLLRLGSLPVRTSRPRS